MMGTYISPIAILGLQPESVEELTDASIRNASKRLMADIELSESQEIEYNGTKLNKSDIHNLINGFSIPSGKEFHFIIFQNKDLLSFLETGLMDSDLTDICGHNRNFLSFLSPYLAGAFSLQYAQSIENWDAKKIELLNAISPCIQPADLETAYAKAERTLILLSEEIDAISERVSDSDDINLIYEEIISLLGKATEFNLGILPNVFDNELDEVSLSLRSVGISLHNDGDMTKEATKIAHIAFRFARSPSVKEKLEKDLRTLRELGVKAAERDKKFRADILSILTNVNAGITEHGRNGIDMGKLSQMFDDVFTLEIIELIKDDGNSKFKESVCQDVVRIIKNFGYKRSKKIAEKFQPIFESSNESAQQFENAIISAKSLDRSDAIKGFGTGILRLVFSRLGFFLLIGIGILYVYFTEDSSSTTSSRGTDSEQTISKNYNNQNNTGQRISADDDTEDYILVGQYRCRQYHASRLDDLKPDANMKSRIDSEEAYLNTETDAIEALGARIEYLSSNLESRYIDNTDQYEVDSYNSDVNTYNQLLETHRSRVSRFNYRKSAYSSLISTYNAEIDKYNNYLEKNCTKCK